MDEHLCNDLLQSKARRQLPHYTDFWSDGRGALWCDVYMTPRLELYWRYTAEQERSGEKWDCSEVWLHDTRHSENTDVCEDLLDCINQLARNKSSDTVRYSLLVNQQGMFYDTNRFGGDCQFVAHSGRRFTFSVRRDDVGDRKILLAIAW